jgi:hypothetical protein
MRSRFAVGRFLGCAVFQTTGHVTSVKRPTLPLFEFRAPSECCLTRPSPPAAADRHLSWAFVPFSTQGHGDPLARALPQPATVRLQGLATLLAAYARRARVGLFSCRRRSWDSPFGAFPSRKVADAFPRRTDPHAVLPVGNPEPQATWAGPNGPRLLGFNPFESPWWPSGD